MMHDDQLRQVLVGLEAQREALSQAILTLRQALDVHDAPEAFVPLKRAAFDTDYCVETLRQWIVAGLVAGQRRGGRWFVSVASLRRYLETRASGILKLPIN